MRNPVLSCALLLLPMLALGQGVPTGDRQVTVETIVVETTRLESTVDAVAHSQASVSRLNVNVACAFFDAVIDDVVDQSNDRRLTGDLG